MDIVQDTVPKYWNHENNPFIAAVIVIDWNCSFGVLWVIILLHDVGSNQLEWIFIFTVKMFL